MKNKLNKELVSVIHAHLPKGENTVLFLMNLLFLGKESIYRRLRGEIPFTFDEIATISSKMGFSIDSIIGLKKSEHGLFGVNLHKELVTEDIYYQKLKNYILFFDELAKFGSSTTQFAENHIPYTFSLFHDSISNFRYYKWLHQTQKISPDLPLSDVVIPKKIIDLQKGWVKRNNKGMSANYLLDNNIFLAITRDVDYFYNRELLTDKELQVLKKDLLQMIDNIEQLAKVGKHPTEAQISLYLLSTDIGATYSHSEYGNNASCYIQMHHVNFLRSYDPQVCQRQKDWLELLKRYSVLITQTGEMQRFEYFKKQREYVFSMGRHLSKS